MDISTVNTLYKVDFGKNHRERVRNSAAAIIPERGVHRNGESQAGTRS